MFELTLEKYADTETGKHPLLNDCSSIHKDILLAKIIKYSHDAKDIAFEALIENDVLHDSILLNLASNEQIAFFQIKGFLFNALESIISDAIEEYNDSIDEKNNEPTRPISDYL